jgi:hypothetical protein
MGGSISRILSGFIWAKKEIRILILGLVWLTKYPFPEAQHGLEFGGQV